MFSFIVSFRHNFVTKISFVSSLFLYYFILHFLCPTFIFSKRSQPADKLFNEIMRRNREERKRQLILSQVMKMIDTSDLRPNSPTTTTLIIAHESPAVSTKTTETRKVTEKSSKHRHHSKKRKRKGKGRKGRKNRKRNNRRKRKHRKLRRKHRKRKPRDAKNGVVWSSIHADTEHEYIDE